MLVITRGYPHLQQKWSISVSIQGFPSRFWRDLRNAPPIPGTKFYKVASLDR